MTEFILDYFYAAKASLKSTDTLVWLVLDRLNFISWRILALFFIVIGLTVQPACEILFHFAGNILETFVV